MHSVSLRTDTGSRFDDDRTSEIIVVTHRVTNAERLDSGVVITFADGRCALYPAALLSATFSQAHEFTFLKDGSDGLEFGLMDGSAKRDI
jgi:hypothetical protein